MSTLYSKGVEMSKSRVLFACTIQRLIDKKKETLICDQVSFGELITHFDNQNFKLKKISIYDSPGAAFVNTNFTNCKISDFVVKNKQLETGKGD